MGEEKLNSRENSGPKERVGLVEWNYQPLGGKRDRNGMMDYGREDRGKGNAWNVNNKITLKKERWQSIKREGKKVLQLGEKIFCTVWINLFLHFDSILGYEMVFRLYACSRLVFTKIDFYACLCSYNQP